MSLQFVICYYTKIVTASLQSDEKVGVVVVLDVTDCAIGEDHLVLEHA